MESVLDSVRSWRDLTAGLLPRVASAAQLEAKRLQQANSSQVGPFRNFSATSPKAPPRRAMHLRGALLSLTLLWDCM